MDKHTYEKYKYESIEIPKRALITLNERIAQDDMNISNIQILSKAIDQLESLIESKKINDSIPKDRIRKLLEEKEHITNSKESMTLDIYIKAKHEIDLLKQLLEEE